ncbi:MAG: carbohydrate porin, partial [Planctomycetes bacterium]|nr:carbohydrate porin [Planctomycetota bacterium]
MPLIRSLPAVFTLCLIGIPAAGEDGDEERDVFQSLLKRSELTGRWGGARPWLEEHGLTFELYYLGEMLANVSGGVRRRAEWLGSADLILRTDLERLAGWKGGEVFLYGLGNHGGNPSENAGDLQAVSNIEAFDTWKLYEAWIEQEILEERLSLLLGLYALDSEFDVIPAADILANSSFGTGAELGLSGINGASIFPTTSLGLRLEVRPVAPIYLRMAVLDGVSGDPDDPRGTRVILDEDDGLLIASEIGWILNPDREVAFAPPSSHYRRGLAAPGGRPSCGYFGKYAAGAWGYTTEFEHVSRIDASGDPCRQRGSYGVYALAEQRAYCEPDNTFHGLSVFARAGLADDRVLVVDAYTAGGLDYNGLLPGRACDRLSLGVAAAHLGAEFRRAASRSGEDLAAWEVALEITYRAMIAPWFFFQPDVQY